MGPRAILTTQDAALVEATALVFSELGFSVLSVDTTRDPTLPKREDLQLRTPESADWIGMVEVKGHRKRGTNDEDITKIERHVANFVREEKRDPSLKIYVCNAQFALPPDERQVPYVGNPGTVQDFANDGVPGLVIPTPDLFRLHRDRHVLGLPEARRRIVTARGVFEYE